LVLSGETGLDNTGSVINNNVLIVRHVILSPIKYATFIKCCSE
jgi:hypothetical protein